MNIVAIGGGEIRNRETLAIDTFIRDLSGKQSPNFLFIPTASHDASVYCDIVREVYGRELGCRYDDLKVMDGALTREMISEKIEAADIIYVGGGNTDFMLHVWKHLEIDKQLISAGERGAILGGVSAGAICWFDQGHSDSESFSDNPDWNYTSVKGLGLIPAMGCPHLNRGIRFDSFYNMVSHHHHLGIGLDERAAIWFRDHHAPIVKTADSRAGVTQFHVSSNTVVTRRLGDNETLLFSGMGDTAITLRPAMPSDAALLCSWWADGRIMRHVGFDEGLKTDGKALAERLAAEQGKDSLFIISIRGVPCGECNVRFSGENRCAIGIKICDSDLQGKGFGEKALRLFLQHLFSKYPLKEIEIDCLASNTRAINLYRKVGFTVTKHHGAGWVDPNGRSLGTVDLVISRAQMYR